MIEIVAEIGASHNQDLQRALDTITAARSAGAHTVKFQTWKQDTMDCGDRIVASGPWKGWKLRDLYAKAWTPWDWFPTLIGHAKSMGLRWLSTPFDAESVDFLQNLGCDRYKIASFEIADIPLIQHVANTGKQVIISTGMATIGEISAASMYVKRKNLTLLHCVSSYPAMAKDYKMYELSDRLAKLASNVGISDHTKGLVVPVLAVACGASMIERHITLGGDGLDDGYASTPEEFSCMVQHVTEAYAAMNRADGKVPDADSSYFKRTLWVVQDVKAGDTITTENVRSARPNEGMSPNMTYVVIGRKFAVDVSCGTPLKSVHIAD